MKSAKSGTPTLQENRTKSNELYDELTKNQKTVGKPLVFPTDYRSQELRQKFRRISYVLPTLTDRSDIVGKKPMDFRRFALST